MPVADVPTHSTVSSRTATPIVRRGPQGTLSTEIGQSMFYSKTGIRRVYNLSSTNSLDSQIDADTTEDLRRINRMDVVSRFPKLQECAHFHYDRVELGKIEVCMYEGSLCGTTTDVSSHLVPSSSDSINNIIFSDDITTTTTNCTQHGQHRTVYHGVEEDGQDYFFTLSVSSQKKTWLIRRTYRDFRKFDRQLHKCVYDRKFSQLQELVKLEVDEDLHGPASLHEVEEVKASLSVYLEQFSLLAGNLINCAPVLNWLELDNRGYRLIASDDSAINTPAVAAVHVVKRYLPQAGDELTLEVGDMISVIDMPPSEESVWWRGKKEWDVGFFPSDCVQVIGGGKMPPSAQSNSARAPVLRRRGKLIAFFRSFLSTRPSRRRLKESGILKERVYGCDLGEHLLNSGLKIPAVLVHCTSFIEEHGIVDGIYRLSGITSNIQKLRLEFDAEKVPNLTEEMYMQDIHSVASVLKLYFRELPNPLLTYQLYDKFVQAVQSADEVRLLKIHDVVNQLPPPHFRTLEYLMRHLARIASAADKTGMNCKNLAIVWAPNLLRSSEAESGVEALKGVGVCAVAVEYLVKYAELIFSNRIRTSSLLARSSGSGGKSTRPKSLAVSTPTKLLTLDEARALTRPNFDHKFIEVGAGPENLPKYHTVIDLPKSRCGISYLANMARMFELIFPNTIIVFIPQMRGKRRNNSTKSAPKSPSTWRNLFVTRNRKQTWPQRAPLTFSASLGACGPSGQFPSQHEEGLYSFKRRKKLRSIQSAESLSVTASAGSLFFRHASSGSESSSLSQSRHLTRNEPSVLRTPVDSRRSHPPSIASVNTHNRSISHDSYFEGSLLAPKEIIDVVKTVAYTECESGMLVKLSFDEEAEIEEEKERRRNEEKPGVMVDVVKAEVHGGGVRYKKLNRTLSPEFLRKYRGVLGVQQSGVKRSLSASPKAVHHLKTDVALTSAKSSGSMGTSFGRTNGSSGGSSGRKSFRRSTSEDDLIRATETEGRPAEDAPRDQTDDVSSGSCYHSNDFIMEEGSHEENEGFESTEMELFDEICAEIYGKEQHDVVASLGPREHDLEERRIELAQKPDSFLDIEEICEEEPEPVSSPRTPASPASLSPLGPSPEISLETSLISPSLSTESASQPSSLGLRPLFTTPSTSSSFFFGSSSQSRPISMFNTDSPTLPETERTLLSPSSPTAVYYFGQSVHRSSEGSPGVTTSTSVVDVVPEENVLPVFYISTLIPDDSSPGSDVDAPVTPHPSPCSPVGTEVLPEIPVTDDLPSWSETGLREDLCDLLFMDTVEAEVDADHSEPAETLLSAQTEQAGNEVENVKSKDILPPALAFGWPNPLHSSSSEDLLVPPRSSAPVPDPWETGPAIPERPFVPQVEETLIPPPLPLSPPPLVYAIILPQEESNKENIPLEEEAVKKLAVVEFVLNMKKPSLSPSPSPSPSSSLSRENEGSEDVEEKDGGKKEKPSVRTLRSRFESGALLDDREDASDPCSTNASLKDKLNALSDLYQHETTIPPISRNERLPSFSQNRSLPSKPGSIRRTATNTANSINANSTPTVIFERGSSGWSRKGSVKEVTVRKEEHAIPTPMSLSMTTPSTTPNNTEKWPIKPVKAETSCSSVMEELSFLVAKRKENVEKSEDTISLNSVSSMGSTCGSRRITKVSQICQMYETTTSAPSSVEVERRSKKADLHTSRPTSAALSSVS